MQDQDHPLRLAVGSHEAGSGRGCAMNVVSWENGDRQITDLPECVDPMLARVVQKINDTYCDHRDHLLPRTGQLLCPECSVKVLALAHRVVGTRLDLELSPRAEVYLRLATWALTQADIISDDFWALDAVDTASKYLSGAPSYLLTEVEQTLSWVVTGAESTEAALTFAHRLVDEFERVTGVQGRAPSRATTERALRSMMAVSL